MIESVGNVARSVFYASALVIVGGCGGGRDRAGGSGNTGGSGDTGGAGGGGGIAVDAASDGNPSQQDAAEPRWPNVKSEPICGVEGWCWIYPRPQGDDLRGVWANTRDDVWAVGERGVVLHYDGRRWNRVPIDYRFRLYSVWGTGPNDVWIGGDEDLILHFDGAAWKTVRYVSGLLRGWTGIHGTGPNDVWFVSQRSEASHWDGTRWSRAILSSDRFQATSVWAFAPNEALLATYEGLVVRATYDPRTNDVTYSRPSQLAPPGTVLHKVWGATADSGWIAGAGDSIYHRTITPNMTSMYVPFPPAIAPEIRGIWGAARNDVWSFGFSGGIAHWDGLRWTASASPTRLNLYDASGTASDDVWAVGEGGVIVHWDGRTWTRDNRPTEETLRDVWVAAPDDVWAVGDRGTIVRSRGDDSFVPVASATTDDLTRIWGASPTNLWIVGTNGTIIEWDGTRLVKWPRMGYELANIWGTSRTDIWVSGSGTLFHFDGDTWLPVPSFEPNVMLGAVWTDDRDRLFVLGDRNRIYDYQPSTGRWTKTTIVGGQLLWGSSPTDLWTSGSLGDGMHYDGTTWTYYRTAQSLYRLWGSGPGDVWGVGGLGEIAHHGPGNGAWMEKFVTDNRFHGVHGSDPDNVWVVGEYGTIMRRPR